MKTERDLTHVKQIPIDMEMLMAILTADGYAKVQAAIKVANGAHNAAVEEAARLIHERGAQWSARAGDENYDRRIARMMMSELAELAIRIRAKLLRAP